MASAISRIHPPSKPIGRIEQHQCRDPVGMRGGQMQWRPRCRTSAPTTTTGPSACCSSSSASAATLASIVHGAVPRRPAVSDQIGCGNGDLGQVSRRQRLPAFAVPGQPVQRQQSQRDRAGP